MLLQLAFCYRFHSFLENSNSSIPSHHPLNSTSPLVVFSPLLIQALHSWPNVLCLQGAAAKDPTSNKPTVCKEKKQLSDIIPTPPAQLLITRHTPLVNRNHTVLKQLLSVPADSTFRGKQLKVDEDGGTRFDDGSEGEIPAVHINNTLLRKHFRNLTASFLKPLERHFNLCREMKGADGIR
jgi:hypothetical protein